MFSTGKVNDVNAGLAEALCTHPQGEFFSDFSFEKTNDLIEKKLNFLKLKLEKNRFPKPGHFLYII